MKTTFTCLIFLISLSIHAQYTAIPDANFEDALAAYDDIPNDGQVPTANIDNLTSLSVQFNGISDLTGIEDFITLEILHCNDNNLSSINVSTLTNLIELNSDRNNISTLDISNNLVLEILRCSHNNLSSLNTTTNTLLKILIFGFNQLSTIDVSNNLLIESLDFRYNNFTQIDVSLLTQIQSIIGDGNNLTSIDLSNNLLLDHLIIGLNMLTQLDVTANTQLDVLWCANNELTSLDVSNNLLLTNLSCFNNDLTNLDVSSNSLLTILKCEVNNLNSLDVSNNLLLTKLFCHWNNLSSLDVSNNSQLTNLRCGESSDLTNLNVKNGANNLLTTFEVINSLNLTCIDVDDEVAANAGTGVYGSWTKDATTMYSEDCSALLVTYVPDDNFEQALIDLGYDSGPLDDYVPTANIETVTSLSILNRGISDLTGVEDFAGLVTLRCQSNNLSSIDISSNLLLKRVELNNNQLNALDLSTNLLIETLGCRGNNLTLLDVSLLSKLDRLECSRNQLTNLNLNNNSMLTNLNCGTNNLSSLDVSDNPLLTSLSCNSNNLNDLDVSDNPLLTLLSCNSNNLNDLDVSANPLLTILGCEGINLSNLDISNNPLITALYVSYNNLVNIDASHLSSLTRINCSNNNLTSLNVKNGNNINVDQFEAFNNPELLCIEVDNEDTSSHLVPWFIDTIARFSEDCSVAVTYVPDDNFEQALIDMGYDSGPLNDYVPTANIENITSLYVNNENISDLTGLEDFVSLAIFECSLNNLTSLDVTNNINLTSLSFIENQIATIDLSNNVALTYLNCGYNSLTSLNLDNNTNLSILNCFSNLLTSLNLSSNNALTELNCNTNAITSLNLSSNTALLNLACAWNNITNLNLSGNNNLETIYCSGNSLAELDVSNKPSLTNLNCDNNQITTLDVGNSPNLIGLVFFYNNLTSIDVSQNPLITEFIGSNNSLFELNVKNGNNAVLINFSAHGNANLNCIQVDDEVSATNGTGVYGAWTKDATASYSESCSTPVLTYIPDDNFEQALINFGYDSGSLDNYVLTNNIEGIIDLNISNLGIQDLTGIQDFTLLKVLDCSNNFISYLDLSTNKKLRNLSCNDNTLDFLNVNNNRNGILKDFNSQNNPSLFCIQVDRPNQATNGNGSYRHWLKDSLAIYSSDCNLSSNQPISTRVLYPSQDKINEFIVLFPNPAKDLINIQSNISFNTIEIYTISGRKISTQNFTNSIDVSELSRGFYLIKLIAKSAIYTKKLVIN